MKTLSRWQAPSFDDLRGCFIKSESYFGGRVGAKSEEAWLSEKICKCLLINGSVFFSLLCHCANHVGYCRHLCLAWITSSITQALDIRWSVSMQVSRWYVLEVQGRHAVLQTPVLIMGLHNLHYQFLSPLLITSEQRIKHNSWPACSLMPR